MVSSLTAYDRLTLVSPSGFGLLASTSHEAASFPFLGAIVLQRRWVAREVWAVERHLRNELESREHLDEYGRCKRVEQS